MMQFYCGARVAFGTKRTCRDDLLFVRFRGKAGMTLGPLLMLWTAANRPPERNNFSTNDNRRLSRHKPDAGSQPVCNGHGRHRSGSVRNAKQGPANSENSAQIGVPPVRSYTCALRRHELLRAAR